MSISEFGLSLDWPTAVAIVAVLVMGVVGVMFTAGCWLALRSIYKPTPQTPSQLAPGSKVNTQYTVEALPNEPAEAVMNVLSRVKEIRVLTLEGVTLFSLQANETNQEEPKP